MRALDLPEFYNAVALLEHNLSERSQKVALHSADQSMTFQAVSDEVNQVGHALKQSGVHFGDFVGILVPDSCEWVTTFFGIIKVGAIAICLNTELEPANYAYILRDSRARVLVIHESLCPLLDPIRDQLLDLEQVIVVGHAQNPADISFTAWIKGQPTVLAAAPTHRDDFCSLNYSSGTTGKPKGVLHAHKDYPLTAQLYGVNVLGLTESDRAFSVSKLYFTYGISGSLILSWYVGASFVLYSGSPRLVTGVLATIHKFQPTILYNVPTGYINILHLKNFMTDYDLSSLRLCISAGEPLQSSTWQAWREQTGLEIYEHIGATETICPFLTNQPGEVRPGSSGKPCVGYEVKLVDDGGHAVPNGDIGNLLVKGETSALFYWHQAEKSRQTFRGPWFFTSDKYYVDEDGFYWHIGTGRRYVKGGRRMGFAYRN